MAYQPKVLWAQTKDDIFLTVDLADATSLKVDLKENSLDVSGVKGNQKYAFSLNFLHPIVTEESKYTTFRDLKFKLVKKESERWPNVTANGKHHWLQCDWDKWIDTDEEENGGGIDMGFDTSAFGMPDQNFDDSDDDEDGLPELNNPVDDEEQDEKIEEMAKELGAQLKEGEEEEKKVDA